MDHRNRAARGERSGFPSDPGLLPDAGHIRPRCSRSSVACWHGRILACRGRPHARTVPSRARARSSPATIPGCRGRRRRPPRPRDAHTRCTATARRPPPQCPRECPCRRTPIAAPVPGVTPALHTIGYIHAWAVPSSGLARRMAGGDVWRHVACWSGQGAAISLSCLEGRYANHEISNTCSIAPSVRARYRRTRYRRILRTPPGAGSGRDTWGDAGGRGGRGTGHDRCRPCVLGWLVHLLVSE